jgi:hypothetical protein
MAATLVIEQESGTYTARIRHPHNGYYAGDFSHVSGAESGRSGPQSTLVSKVDQYVSAAIEGFAIPDAAVAVTRGDRVLMG